EAVEVLDGEAGVLEGPEDGLARQLGLGQWLRLASLVVLGRADADDCGLVLQRHAVFVSYRASGDLSILNSRWRSPGLSADCACSTCRTAPPAPRPPRRSRTSAPTSCTSSSPVAARSARRRDTR